MAKKKAQRGKQTGKSSGGTFEFRDRTGKVHRAGGGSAGQSEGRAPQARKPHAEREPGFKHKAQPHQQSAAHKTGGKRHGDERPQRQGKQRDQGHDRDRNPRDRGRGRNGEGRTAPKGGSIKLKATVDKNQKGFGFLIFEDRRYEDAFIPPREADKYFHGDRVEVEITSRGEVLDIHVLQHRFRELVGRFSPHPMGRGGWVVYERKRAREEVYVPEKFTAPAGHAPVKSGDWVRAKLHFSQTGPFPVTAEIAEIYGEQLPPSADIGMVSSEYNLVEEHSSASVREAEALRLEIPERDLEGRVDLREVPFITIDGETARDFDDAVYVERDKSGFILWVAIADVSHYVREGRPLDDEAFSRGTSVYFPERAFHMLPRALSENLCSLRPKEPRLAMVAKMYFDRTGARQSTEVMEAVIESKRRATYNEIQSEWEAHRNDPQWEYAAHFALYQEIKKRRHQRGSIDIEFPEAELRVEPTGEVISIKQRPRLDAHRLIEEFMIAANEAVTDWMMEREWPFVYRVHDEPSMEKLEAFERLAANVGVKFSIERDAEPRVLSDLVRRLVGHPAQALLSTALLRSMKQAIYSATHGIHFGLASPGYTHFTSPIRRYPDLVVHRLIRQVIRIEAGREQDLKAKERERLEERLAEICEHCSYRERLASDAERESVKLKQVRAMVPHVGDEFDAKIVGMIESGFFVEIADPFVEGLVSRDSMTDDFYQFNEDRMLFIGRRKKRQFKIGEMVKVRCLRADTDRRQIDFGLLE